MNKFKVGDIIISSNETDNLYGPLEIVAVSENEGYIVKIHKQKHNDYYKGFKVDNNYANHYWFLEPNYHLKQIVSDL
jgi:hypothetical protein